MQALPDFLARVTPPQTPALVVRRAALDANIAAMQAACDAARNGDGVRLRAHGKMHKCSELGRAQVRAGAVGLCCQTVGEAEAYARAGIADVLVTAPVPPWGWPRLAVLAAGGVRVGAVVDSMAQLVRAEGSGLTLYVDVDLGQHRAGVTPEEAPALAAAIAATPGVIYGGVQAYCGHVQHQLPEARRMANDAATARLQALIAALRAAGLAPPQVTGGGTGSYAYDLAGGVFTELQAGSYALMDVEYGDCGGPEGDWPFQPALFIAATIVSARHRAFVTSDAGLKAVHTNGPPPRVIAGALPGSLWRSFGDEHGGILHPAFLERLRNARDPVAVVDALDAEGPLPADAPAEGSLVWLQPGHVDPTVALHDAYFVADEDGRLERWAIDARRVS
jgi:D-serine deaminase-like pyridoxal phosphate-dependent protein